MVRWRCLKISMYRSLNWKPNIAIDLGNIAGLYAEQGDVELAIRYYRESLPLAEEVNYTITYARFANGLAGCYLALDDLKQAREYANIAFERARGLKHRQITAAANGTLSTIAWREGKRDETFRRMNESLTAYEEIGDVATQASVHTAICSRRLEIGEIEKGLLDCDRARELASKAKIAMQVYQALVISGHGLLRLGRLPEARAQLEEAVAVIESVRSKIGGGADTRQSFFDDKHFAYYDLMQIAFTEGDVERAFQYGERSRMKALLDVMAEREKGVDSVITIGERNREKEIERRLSARNLELARARRGTSAPAIARAEALLTEARLERKDFDAGLYAAHPELRSRTADRPPVSAGEMAALLPADSALLDYVVLEHFTLLYVLRRGAEPQVIRIDVGLLKWRSG